MEWKDVDWNLLTQMRANFLCENPGQAGDYWASRRHLEHYDLSFAARIGWKWEAVLNEARELGWKPTSNTPLLVDWGCGTGIAARTFLANGKSLEKAKVQFWDRSGAAREIAMEFTRSEFPQSESSEWKKGSPLGSEFILLLSHILNELPTPFPRELEDLIEQADTVFWVEPGTPKISLRLIEVREKFRAHFAPIAPCPHRGPCGMLAPEQTRNWCHHFAEPPRAAFQTAGWQRFSRELGIDLRSLPVSYLVLSKRPLAPISPNRVIGRPRLYKGYALALKCDSFGLHEERVLKRHHPDFLKLAKPGEFRMAVPSSPKKAD